VGTTLNNSSSCTTTGAAAPTLLAPCLPSSILNRYSNYSNLTPVTLVAGQTYTTNIDISNCSGIAFSMGHAVFIDVNRNGIWDLPGERFVASPGITPGPASPAFTTMIDNFTIPATAAPGITLMRVIVNEGVNGTNISPTTNPTWGESEDYLVNLIGYGADTVNSYSWTGSNGFTSPNRVDTNTIATTTSYTVVSTNALGCTASSTVTVSLTPLVCGPVVLYKDSICSGDTLSVRGTTLGGGIPSYTWTGPNTGIWTSNIINPNSATPILSASHTLGTQQVATFTVTILDACGATCSTTVNIKVNPGPQVTVLNSNPNICISGNSILTAIGTSPNSTIASYVWTGPANITPTNAATTVASINSGSAAIGPNNYVVTVTDALGCKTSTSVVINFSPAYSINAVAIPSVLGSCGGVAYLQTVDTVNGPQNMPTPYCNPAHITGDQSGSGITFFSVGTLSNASNGAIGIPNANNIYNYYPAVPAVTLIPGQTYTAVFNAEPAGGTIYTGANITMTIDWNRDLAWDPNEFYAITAPVGIATGTTISFPFTVPATATPGITKLRIRTRGSGNTNNFASLCTNYGSGELEDYAVNILAAPPVAIVSHSWAESNPVGTTLLSGTVGALVPATLGPSTTYTVTATNAYGCTATATTAISITPLSALNVVTQSTVVNKICEGKCDSVRITWAGGTNPKNVIFTPNNFITKVNDSLYLACPDSTKLYNVVVVDSCGDSVNANFTIHINNRPIVTFDSLVVNRCNGPGTATIGPAISLTANTYAWSPNGANTPAFTIANANFIQTFTVTVTDFFGCTNTATQQLWVSNPHNIKISTTPALAACFGDSASLGFTDTTLNIGTPYAPSGYCIPGVHVNNQGDHITLVTFGSINNATGACLTVPVGTGYCGLQAVATPTISCNSSTALTVRVFDGTIGTADFEQAGAWFDWNRNGSFEASEYLLIPLVKTPVGAAFSWNGTISVTPPAGVSAGATRMRIRSRYAASNAANQLIGPADTCSAYAFGETEDYLISVTCNGPANLATWSWTANPATVTAAPNLNPVFTSPLTTTTIFTLSVVDAGGCVFTNSKTVTVNPLIVIDTTVYDALCFGQSDGSIVVTPSGGTAPYSFSLTNLNTNAILTGGTGILKDSFFNLPAGLYEIKVLDAITCSKTMIVEVTQPDSIYTSFDAGSASCFGGVSTFLVVEAFGGTCPYSYAWIDQITSAQFTNTSSGGNPICGPDTNFGLPFGCYKIFVFDINGCQIHPAPNPFVEFCVAQPSGPLALNIVSIDSIDCAGDDNAIITVNATGGTPGYRYGIDNINLNTYTSNNVFTGVAAGLHTIYVTDTTNICLDSLVIDITEPDSLLQVINVVNPLCKNLTGTITLSTIGGTGATSCTINGAPVAASYPAGSYLAVCTDSKMCTVSTNIILTEPDSLKAIALAQTNPLTCNGDSSILVVNPIGGTPGYVINVNPSSANGFYKAGTYTINVTDTNSCVYNTSYTINQPNALLLVVDTINAACANLNGQIVILNQSGGTGPLTVTVNGNAYTSGNYPIGAYNVRLTDSVGCFVDTNVQISGPSPLAISPTLTNPTCYNDTCGSIVLNVLGGTLPYTDTTINSAAVKACYGQGGYLIVVTDATGCTGSTIALLTAPPAIVTNITTIDPLCFGLLGAINYTVSGGTGSLNVLIDNQVIPSGSTINAGTHVMVTTDATGCSKVDTFEIIEPTELLLNDSLVLPKCVGDSGRLFTNIMGGTGSIKAGIINVFGDTLNISASSNTLLAPGNYTVYAGDANQCLTILGLFISPATPITLAPTVVNALCADSANGSIDLIVSGGTAPYIFKIDGIPSSLPFVGLFADTFAIEVTDFNGCKKDTTIIITEPAPLNLGVITTNPACANSCGNITTSVNGGTGNYTVTVNGQGVSTCYTQGSYNVQVVDDNGCMAETNTTITSPSSIVIIDSVIQPKCAGECGQIYITANGGTGALVIGGLNANNCYSAGTYTISVEDANNCSTTIAIVIDPAPTPIFVQTGISQPVCNGQLGSISFVISGGVGNYQIEDVIAGTNITSPYTGLSANNYNFVITDGNGCDTIASAIINMAPPALVVSANVVNPSCATGGSTGTINLTISGGTGTYIDSSINYLPISNPYPIGDYTLVAQDNNGCTDTAYAQILAAATFGVQANAIDTTVCKNTIVTLFGSNTTNNTGLTYTWAAPAGFTNPANNIPFSLTANGIYTVTGSDGSCQETSTIEVFIDPNAQNLSQAALSNSASNPGNSCSPLSFQPDDAYIDYRDPSCNLIASVDDASGGNVLGTVTSCVTVNATVPTFNGQPFVARWFTITVANNGPANVTLYFTNDDILDYNNYIVNNGITQYPQLNNPNGSIPANGDVITNASVTQISGGTLGVGTFIQTPPVTLTYDATLMAWRTSAFAVPSFSNFYLHTTNPNNTPLSVNVLEFKGRKEGSADVLTWTTAKESDNSHYNVLYSTDGNDYKQVGTVNTLAANGNSNTPLNYDYTYTKPTIGHNYYKLQFVNVSGVIAAHNQIVDLVRDVNGNSVVIYPNPTQNELHVDVTIEKATNATLRVLDATGKLVKVVETELQAGFNSTVIDLGELASGAYMIKVTDSKGLNFAQQFSKQ
jgi:hypothetical protein